MLCLIPVTGTDAHTVHVWVMCFNFVYFPLECDLLCCYSRLIDLEVLTIFPESHAHLFTEQNFQSFVVKALLANHLADIGLGAQVAPTGF